MTDAWTTMMKGMLEQSQQMARAFNPALETFKVKGFEDLIPTMSKDFMEMAFGRTFNRDGLDAKTRMRALPRKTKRHKRDVDLLCR